MIPCRKNYD
jgi:calpain-15